LSVLRLSVPPSSIAFFDVPFRVKFCSPWRVYKTLDKSTLNVPIRKKTVGLLPPFFLVWSSLFPLIPFVLSFLLWNGAASARGLVAFGCFRIFLVKPLSPFFFPFLFFRRRGTPSDVFLLLLPGRQSRPIGSLFLPFLKNRFLFFVAG